MEGGTNLSRVDPAFSLCPQPVLQAFAWLAPLRLLADKILILVCFLDPGQRSDAAFAKRGSLLAGPLAKRLCQSADENKQQDAVSHNETLLRCSFALLPKTRILSAKIGKGWPWKNFRGGV
jgi:hypothetical protein